MFHVGMTKTLSFSLDKEDTTWDFQPTDDSNHGLCGQTCRPSLRHSVLGVTTARLPAQPWQKSCPQRWSSSSFKLAHSARLVQASKLRVSSCRKAQIPLLLLLLPFPHPRTIWRYVFPPCPTTGSLIKATSPPNPTSLPTKARPWSNRWAKIPPLSVSLPFSIILRGQQSHQEAAFETET